MIDKIIARLNSPAPPIDPIAECWRVLGWFGLFFAVVIGVLAVYLIWLLFFGRAHKEEIIRQEVSLADYQKSLDAFQKWHSEQGEPGQVRGRYG